MQLGARFAVTHGVLLHLLVEDNISALWASQFRVIALVDVSVLLGARGFGQATPRGVGPVAGNFGSGYGMGSGW
jgi:hypothetical protein